MMAFLRGYQRHIRLLLAGICIGAGLGIVILFGFGGKIPLPWMNGLTTPAEVPYPIIDQPAPDFNLRTVEGDSLTLSAFKGKIVLLNFWATWCVPCQQEMPLLQDRARRYPSNLAVMGINDDETPSLVQDFATGLEITFPILLDPGSKVQDLYRVRGYPTSIFIDSQGIIRIVHIGELSGTMLDDYLKKLGIGS
jgi:peroxiredoxin